MLQLIVLCNWVKQADLSIPLFDHVKITYKWVYGGHTLSVYLCSIVGKVCLFWHDFSLL